MRVKHYPRVSSKKQADEGDSIEFQNKRLKEDSINKKDEIVSVHTDAGMSASLNEDKIKISYKDGIIHAKIDISKRIGMVNILDSLDNNDWDALKVTKWDRFSRNNIFTQLMISYFKEHGKEIIAVDDSNESLVRDILSVLGQEEIKKNKQRVRDVRILRFEKGIFPARSPYGYRPIIRDKKVFGFKIYHKESEVVAGCFKMASEGNDYKDICSTYGLKPQQYYNIIRNKAYCGYVIFEGQERKGVHEPIISEELFNKCQKN